MGVAREVFEQFKKGGYRRVLDAKQSNESESPYLDFKTNREGGKPASRLTPQTRKVLAKAISAFANAEGGVLVWGVDAKENKAVDLAPVPQVSEFLHSLNNETGASVDPPVLGIEHHPIKQRGGKGAGFVVTYIPMGNDRPHLAMLGVDQYLVRLGSSSVAMPNFMTRALILARARPELQLVPVLPVQITRDGRVINRITGETRFLGNFNFAAIVPLRLRNIGTVAAKEIAVAFANDDTRAVFQPNAFFDQRSHPASLPISESTNTTASYDLFIGSGGLLYPGLTVEIGKMCYRFNSTSEVDYIGKEYAIFAEDFLSQSVLNIPSEMIRS